MLVAVWVQQLLQAALQPLLLPLFALPADDLNPLSAHICICPLLQSKAVGGFLQQCISALGPARRPEEAARRRGNLSLLIMLTRGSQRRDTQPNRLVLQTCWSCI